MDREIPKKWKKSDKAVKAVQIAFEMENKVATKIKTKAARNNLNPSDQIRKILGLSYNKPIRPRLTVSLTPEDYKILGEKYSIDPSKTLDIKAKMIEELIDYHEKTKRKNPQKEK